jgi:hypothetical protein
MTIEFGFNKDGKPISVSDNPAFGILTIEGVNYSYEFFHAMGKDGLKVGEKFIITERYDDGQPIISIAKED